MIQIYRLTNEPNGLGLRCTSAGLSLAGVPLLESTKVGFVPRPANAIGLLIKAAYGAEDALTGLQSSLRVVADALNRGDLARATMAAVLSRTPELSRQAAVRLARAEKRLTKYNFNPNEPRDWLGEWARDGANAEEGGVAASSDELRVRQSASQFETRPQNPRQRSTNTRPTPVAFAASSHSATDGGSAAFPGLNVEDDAQLTSVVLAVQNSSGDDEVTASQSTQSSNLREDAFERTYDDLSPVDFAKRVAEFGYRLETQGRNLSAAGRARALAQYSFLQGRLSFWLAYGYKSPATHQNLLFAATYLYRGAIRSGIVQVGHLPASMLDVFEAAWGLEGGQPRIRSAGDLELPVIAPSRVSEEFEGLGGIVNNSKVRITWGKGIEDQNGSWETYVGKQHPETTNLPPKSKAFDHFASDSGDAISDKTLFTQTFSRINQPRTLYSKLKGYIDFTANYKKPRAKFDIDPSKIKTRTIQLAIPEYTSPTQWRYLYKAIRYGRQRGVRVVVTRIRE
jgi:hypothetical protein